MLIRIQVNLLYVHSPQRISFPLFIPELHKILQKTPTTFCTGRPVLHTWTEGRNDLWGEEVFVNPRVPVLTFHEFLGLHFKENVFIEDYIY